jgi:pimeloyl-ACP methyl ester carboxylesterase
MDLFAHAPAPFDRPHDFVQLPDGKLAYYRVGRGSDVVFVHGWPLWSATWRHLVPRLAKRFTLHFIELPGTGRSLDWRGPIHIEAHAATMRQVIDRLQLSSYAMVAHDSGGTIARLVAADDARVRALVLGNTELTRHVPWQLRVYLWAAKRPWLARAFVAAMRVGVLRRSAVGFGGTFADARYADGEFGDLFVRPLVASPEVARGQMALATQFDLGVLDRLDDVHRRIAAPALMVWGTHDPFFPLARMKTMLPELGGGATVVEIPRGKLFVHEDHAEAFGAAAEPFLARHLSLTAAA